ncbi:MAG: exo-alpha-sialidase [SAR202 cluster bacterium]|nr:exo-alpha-sialidase [SAR202 cluster bacterium]
MLRFRRLLLIVSLALAHVAIAGAVSADVQVNDPTTDTGDSTTQSETALALGNGVLCAGFNDFGPNGLSGWARSTDFGVTWTDLGGINESGDPVIAYHVASDTFYYASLGNVSPRVNASTDGCQSWGTAVSVTSTGTAQTTLADKPWIAVDNSGGANDGNMYICWTRFFNPGGGGTSELRVARSTDGGGT